MNRTKTHHPVIESRIPGYLPRIVDCDSLAIPAQSPKVRDAVENVRRQAVTTSNQDGYENAASDSHLFHSPENAGYFITHIAPSPRLLLCPLRFLVPVFFSSE